MLEETITKPQRGARLQRFLLISGIPVLLFASALVARIIWEETSLTLQQGPQMIGFSLAHGAGGILFLAPLVMAIWMAVSLTTFLVALFRKWALSKSLIGVFACSIFLLSGISLPSVFWQWLLMSSFSRSAHASDLMVYAAYEGDLRTVCGYLGYGVPIEATDYEGATAAFAASRTGRLELLKLLASKGANLNAVNAYGDSPLEGAISAHSGATASFLRLHGGVNIKGTPEQRQAASEAIVQKEIEKEERGYRDSTKSRD